MKKLKLDLHNLEGEQVLTREQLKLVLGGDDGGGACRVSTCSLSIQGDNGAWETRDGSCLVDASSFYGSVLSGNKPYCYCETGLGDIPVTSNGGVSKCN